MRFRLILAATAASAAVATAAAAAATPDSSSTPPCIPKVTSSGGHATVDYCGPATATLKLGGKTYNFKNGYCHTDTKNHISLGLTLGVIEASAKPGNGGQPLFEMTALTADGLSISTVNADYAGKVLDSAGTVKLKGSIPSGGTFASTGFAKPSFSGSWNCHGVVVSMP